MSLTLKGALPCACCIDSPSWSCKRSCVRAGDSTRLLTGSADSSAKLWDVETGENLFTFSFREPCKAVAFSLGDHMAAISTDPFMGRDPAIHLVNIAEDPADQSKDIVSTLEGFKSRINRVAFTDLNKTLISAGEDGFVRRWDVEVSGKV